MTNLETLYDYCRLERNTAEREVKYLKRHALPHDMEASHKRAAREATVYTLAKVMRRIDQLKKEQ